ncbi:MAG: RNase adapter RapZ [Propionibacteriaceae bacterium]|jgi:UPF0042 nucleotide-binding protein|nr:RNase adapter RapZ [Propionibacteriaceae bacterium]
MELVIITGMSGAGRRSVAHTMEDVGWYVVDNLPPAMLPSLIRYLGEAGTTKVGVVLDVRSRGDLEQIPSLFAQIAEWVGSPHILYVEATDAEIVKRQESSRRPVPLQGTGPLLEGIRAERRMTSALRASADMVVDTTNLTIHQLQARIVAAYSDDQQDLTMTVMSFGFKNGVPLDADIVLDMRFLPNPHWVPELRQQTGQSRAVSTYVLGFEMAQTFLAQAEKLLSTVFLGYVEEGKRNVLVGVGCTGGKHRSVAMAEELGARLRAAGYGASVLHRDLGRE